MRARLGIIEGHRDTRENIATTIRALVQSFNVVVDEEAVEAGLVFLEAGGDFADGVIALEGQRLGGEEFVSFDRKAVRLALVQGRNARLLS